MINIYYIEVLILIIKKLEQLGHIIIMVRINLCLYNQGNIYDKDAIIEIIDELYFLGFIESIDYLLRYIDNLYDGMPV